MFLVIHNVHEGKKFKKRVEEKSFIRVILLDKTNKKNAEIHGVFY